jgi:cell division transport system ATP-binding protein
MDANGDVFESDDVTALGALAYASREQGLGLTIQNFGWGYYVSEIGGYEALGFDGWASFGRGPCGSVFPQASMIELYHVSKAYERAAAPALDDVNLHVGKGEFVFLTGRSGAGKTTLLRLLFLAERCSRGQVFIAGRNVAHLKDAQLPHLRRCIGVVFQDFKLMENRTVEQNVALALEVQGLAVDAVKGRVFETLRRVGLAHKRSSLPQILSGGEQQRVAIARAIVAEPLLLLADEPTGNLDPERAVDIMNLLTEVNTRGTTVMVATHDPGLVEKYPHRVIVLEAGRVTSAGL